VRLPTLRASSPPTLARARAKLGGAATSFHEAGTIVTVKGSDLRGVVLGGDADTCDVWFEANAVKRVRRDRLVRGGAGDDGELARMRNDALVFASLEPNQRVAFDAGGGTEAGVLFEKCRWGGLVARADGTIVAIGFRRIWPAAGASA
jgi:hypothetical protein